MSEIKGPVKVHTTRANRRIIDASGQDVPLIAIAAALNSRAALAAELEAVKANVTALIKEYSHIAEGAMADGDHADYLRWNYHAEQLEAALRTQQGGGG